MLSYLLGYRVHSPAVVHVPDQHLPTTEDMILKARIDALELAFAGLWRLLKEPGFTDDQLVAKMEQADLEDGVRDGKVRANEGKCPQCQKRPLSRTSTKCLWCGAEMPHQLPR